ncbi:MAG: hypothetical protein LH632_00930 [Rhodoferax sp.]|nr:hypothetical protein [Rhodoferax sp.]
MVYKGLDAVDWNAKSPIARFSGDDQMLSDLRRFFGTSTRVAVINQLCGRTAGVVTRVYHLLIHAHGLAVVDSRSLSGSYRDQEGGRSTCLEPFNAGEIRSPVLATYEQALSLKGLQEKKVRRKGFFDEVEPDVLISAPDLEVIEWNRKGPLREVCNAVQVTRRVMWPIAQYRSKGRGVGVLVPEQRRRMALFLCAKHLPAISGGRAMPGHASSMASG